MNAEAQRVAIAEACGWKPVKNSGYGCQIWERGNDEAFTAMALPNYLNDLNAMYEAEKVLTPDQCFDYNERLESLDKFADGINYAFHVTPAQRAEAFLRTINKWQNA